MVRGGVKPRLDAPAAKAVLAYCFDVALRLLHPCPFITEELWQKLPGRKAEELIAVTEWPAHRSELEDPEADAQFARVKTAIERIRSIRAEYRIPPRAARGGDRAARGDRKATFEASAIRSCALRSLPP